ncbi:tetratricopeptide repeat protein, partial [Streptomyces sp. NPDC059956]|uniref:tetratricopeptide repeat protein n=1 Tax=Streptomyces sp. NPDC059956 TaxID=3347015 RepID=UPI00365282F9
MTTNPSNAARININGGHQEYVITAGSISGPVTITTTGARVPAYLQNPQRWVLVEDWDALAAGAHRARPDDTGDAVPTYVARDADEELLARLTRAARDGGLVLVLGESTAGKTRAAHRAVRECEALAGYRVLAPDTGADLVIAADVVATTSVRCLVWLDDLERFLTPDGLEAGVLAELVRLRTPLLATMQLRHHDTFSRHSTDPRQEVSSGLRTSGTGARVLKQTDPLYLQRRWSAEELTRAQDCDDLRIIDAVTHHGPYGVAEYLAAGPALLTEWRNATRPGGHPRGAALVAAAVDLNRTGLRPPYPTTLLTTLHQHYLPDDPLLRPESIDTALTWATRLRYGATSLLLPTNNPDAWDVFDYLPDHTTSPVTEHAWHSALDHATDDKQHIIIGIHAFDTAPLVAETAFRSVVPRGEPHAPILLGGLLAKMKRYEEAEPFLLQAADAGNTNAEVALGSMLALAGRLDEAEVRFRRATEAGDARAAALLGRMLLREGRSEEAEPLLRQAADTDEADDQVLLGRVFLKEGRSEEAEPLLRQAADTGGADAKRLLGQMLLQEGRTEEAEPFLRQAVDEGDIPASTALGVLLLQSGRSEEAESLLRQAADEGDIPASTALGSLLLQSGRSEEAEPLLRQAADTGNTHAKVLLGILLTNDGRSEEAEPLLRQAADEDEDNANTRVLLGILLTNDGRSEEAEPFLRQAAATDTDTD